MANFLHGVEFTEFGPPSQPAVQINRSAVIGLVGTAPSWAASAPPPPNTPTLVTSPNDALKYFGPVIQGYSIPYALQKIFAQGPANVIVINVFDQTQEHFASGGREINRTMPATGPAIINLGGMGISPSGLSAGYNAVEKSDGSVTYVEGTDYSFDYVNGLLIRKSSGAIALGEALLIKVQFQNPANTVDADIIGSISGGVYKGMQAFLRCWALFGLFPKILLAPGFTDATVVAALDALAQTMRAYALGDSPPSTQIAAIIANTGTPGNAFYTNSKRTILCGPQQKFNDAGIVTGGVTLDALGNPVLAYANDTAVGPLSPFAAGAMANGRTVNGYWISPSDQVLIGDLGPDVTMYVNPFDPESDPNQLNANGVMTVLTSGAVVRLWGNRSASFPTYTTPDVFIAVRTSLDLLEEALTLQALAAGPAGGGQDAPITNAQITDLLQQGQQLVNSMIQQGALQPGSLLTYDAANNPPSQLENGQTVLSLDTMGPVPNERISYLLYVDSTLLADAIGNPGSNNQTS